MSSEAFIHPSAEVESSAQIGPGTRVWHFCHVMAGARIGRDGVLGQNVMVGPNVVIGDRVRIQNNVSVYAGVTLEDEVFCGPSVVFTNVVQPRAHLRKHHAFAPTRVGRGATLGANATVLCGLTLGRWCFVGAGAVVTRSVPDHALVYGHPARQHGWVCRCGMKLPLPLRGAPGERAVCTDCGEGYLRTATGVQVEDPA